MAPEKIAWGARADKVPVVSGVRESLQTMAIVSPKKTEKNENKCLRIL